MFVDVPRGPLFAGRIAPLTLTCNIYITNATDMNVVVMDTDVMWFRGNPDTSDPLSNSDTRVAISSVSGSRPLFISVLTLDPLSTEDNTTFTCRARANRPVGQPGFVTDSEIGEGVTSIIANCKWLEIGQFLMYENSLLM